MHHGPTLWTVQISFEIAITITILVRVKKHVIFKMDGTCCNFVQYQVLFAHPCSFVRGRTQQTLLRGLTSSATGYSRSMVPLNVQAPVSTRQPRSPSIAFVILPPTFSPSGLSFSLPLAVRGTHVGPTMYIVSFPLWCALLPRFLFTHPLELPESNGQLGQLPDSWLLAILPPQSHRCYVVHRGKGKIRFGNLIK